MADRILENDLKSFLSGKKFFANIDCVIQPNSDKVILFRNQSANGKRVFLDKIYIQPITNPNDLFDIKIYLNPTVTSPGNVVPIRPHVLKNTPPSSEMDCFQDPTLAQDGVYALRVINDNIKGVIVHSGKSFLIKIRHNASVEETAGFFLSWAEI